ncbi:MAG: DUF2283 domain-containing protein [candidate division Zixibacteria bacterium]|nr:DUF2283 domain-containing protein [candidate division Zixibacteria bacterium]
MASLELKRILDVVPQLVRIPYEQIWSSYDKEADVLYLNFKKPSHADDSELTDDDIIIRYEKGEIVGITILNASKRGKSN